MRAGLLPVLLVGAAQASAQGVAVRVLDDREAPVRGALVSLRLAGRTTQERLTNVNGLGLLIAPPATGYTVEVRRVGFEPFVSSAFAVASDTATLELRVPARRAVLPQPPRGNECRAGGAGLARAGALWEHLRVALTSAEIVRTESLEPLAIRRYERSFGRDGERRSESVVDAARRGTRPFLTAPPDELSRDGFSVNDSLGQVLFRAPDAAVLLSPEFAADHCFSLLRGSGPTNGLLGLAFAPVPSRRVTDVQGVMWADAATSELRFAEFTYRFPTPLDVADVGGRIMFEQLGSANWIAREWVVRTPVLTQRGQVLGYREEGGEAMTVSPQMKLVMDSIANARKVPGLVTGVIMDSLSGAPFAGARVWIENGPQGRTDPRGVYFLRGVVPGRHVVRFSHPVLDSLGVVPRGAFVNVVSEQMSDANLAGPSFETFSGGACARLGIITGLVRDIVTGNPVDSATVTLSWMEVDLDQENRPVRITPIDVVAQTDSTGRYAACVSASHEITGVAQRGVARSGGVDITPDARRLGILHLALDMSATDSLQGAAELRGIAKYQDGTPLRNAIVTLTDPELATTTDTAGVFRLRNIPGGTRVFDTRALGHAPVRSIADLKPGDTATVSVYLRKVTMLDAVIVRAAADDNAARTLAELAERRKRRVGFRISASQLLAFKGSRLDAPLRMIPFATVRTSPVVSITMQDAGGRACMPTVWMDGRRTSISYVAALRAEDVLAIEVMRLREVPTEYQTMGECGALLVWLRR